MMRATKILFARALAGTYQCVLLGLNNMTGTQGLYAHVYRCAVDQLCCRFTLFIRRDGLVVKIREMGNQGMGWWLMHTYSELPCCLTTKATATTGWAVKHVPGSLGRFCGIPKPASYGWVAVVDWLSLMRF